MRYPGRRSTRLSRLLSTRYRAICSQSARAINIGHRLIFLDFARAIHLLVALSKPATTLAHRVGCGRRRNYTKYVRMRQVMASPSDPPVDIYPAAAHGQMRSRLHDVLALARP